MYTRRMPHAHLDASLNIHAPAQAVFDRMGDLSRLNDWNLFPQMDPTTVSRHESKRLGKGRMQVVSVDAFDQERSLGMHLMGKLIFDRMMTKSLQSGLERLKSLVETENATPPRDAQ